MARSAPRRDRRDVRRPTNHAHRVGDRTREAPRPRDFPSSCSPPTGMTGVGSHVAFGNCDLLTTGVLVRRIASRPVPARGADEVEPNQWFDPQFRTRCSGRPQGHAAAWSNDDSTPQDALWVVLELARSDASIMVTRCHMKISTVREFRDKATGLLRSRTPILVTRRGRLAGIFFPRPEVALANRAQARAIRDAQQRRTTAAEATTGL